MPNTIVKMVKSCPVINLEKKCSNAFFLFLTLKKCSKLLKTKELKIKIEKPQKIKLHTQNHTVKNLP